MRAETGRFKSRCGPSFFPALVFGVCLLSGCTLFSSLFSSGDRLTLEKTTFDDLPGWTADNQSMALMALGRSCAKMTAMPPKTVFTVGGEKVTLQSWQKICADLAALQQKKPKLKSAEKDARRARRFIEDRFTPYVMRGKNGTQGIFTGYYEPTLHGSYHRHGAYDVPIYGRPDNLVTVDLGAFSPKLAGQHIVGRVDKDKSLVPYYNRTAINKGMLKGKSDTIVWVNNPVDAFFLHIQGSGRIHMKDGTVLRVGYAAQNGLPYVAIGRAMVEKGYLPKDNVSMQSIRAWLESHPALAARVMDINESYIFFRKLKKATGPLDGPLGAEGVPLVPRRSLAVDHHLIPYGVPIWIDAQRPMDEKKRDADSGKNIQRLMVAQDTGGAITGAVRGDFFWGAGKEATAMAGLMDSKGRAWMLLPTPPAQPSVWRARFDRWWQDVAGVFQHKEKQHGE